MNNQNQSNNKSTWILLIVLFFSAGVAGTYVFLTRFAPPNTQSSDVRYSENLPAVAEDLITVRLYYPRYDRIETAEKKLPKRTKTLAFAEALLDELFKDQGKPGTSPIPPQVKVLGVYRDLGTTIYVDLSDEVRRNFQGDIAGEYFLLKGIYETLTANLREFQNVKILVEGKEIESIGGHFQLGLPLSELLGIAPSGENSPTE